MFYLQKQKSKFAEEKLQVSNDDKRIIYHARKSLLFNEEGT